MMIARNGCMTSIKRILILDGDPKASDVLGRLLELYSQSVESSVAYTPLSATHLACTGDFDIVIIDTHLGEVDGGDVAKAIRSRCGHSLPKLIAVSSDRARVAAERSASLFDLALDKPLVVEKLFEAIQSV
jgi:CheY-like chemotaxis protein